LKPNIIIAVATINFLAFDVVHSVAAFIGAQTAISLSTDISVRKRPDVMPAEFATYQNDLAREKTSMEKVRHARILPCFGKHVHVN
jgi:hypothetical protein